MEITAIRHLPTEWNRLGKLQGRKDIQLLPISEEAQEGVSKNLQRISEQAFDYVLCSSLIRTKQTAEVYGFTPIMESLIDELDFGPYEGRSKEVLLKETDYKWLNNPIELELGESLIEFQDRLALFLDIYKKASKILIFGHGSWMRALASYYKYGHINNMNKMTIQNNELHTFEFLTVEV